MNREEDQKRPSFRLGGGDYDPGELGLFDARFLFLDAIKRMFPSVLADLNNLMDDPSEDALIAWADCNGLTERSLGDRQWLWEAAKDTLSLWQACGYSNRWVMKISNCFPSELRNLEFQFESKGWDPIFGETKTSFKKRILKEFQNYLTSYIEGKEEIISELGYSKTKEIRGREHFEWLAMWILGDYSSFGEVGKEEGYDRDHISNAIKAAAEKCGFPIPKGEEGVPGSRGIPPLK